MFQEFPMWVTHDDGRSKLVESEKAFEALGDGWKRPDTVTSVPREETPDFQEFPKMVYSPTDAPRIVADADEQAALGDNWYETLVEAAAERLLEADEKDVLLERARAAGVAVDGRWSVAKIKLALESVPS